MVLQGSGRTPNAKVAGWTPARATSSPYPFIRKPQNIANPFSLFALPFTAIPILAKRRERELMGVSFRHGLWDERSSRVRWFQIPDPTFQLPFLDCGG